MKSADVRVTVVMTSRYYKKYTKFIFSKEGKELYDRGKTSAYIVRVRVLGIIE